MSRKLIVALCAGSMLLLASAVMTHAAPKKDVKHGLDVAGMDRSVKPGNDFYDYANGAWLEKTKIPADRSSWSSFSKLAEQGNKRTAELIQEVASSSGKVSPGARKVGEFYTAFMNKAAIDKKGMSPAEPELATIAALKDKRELARFLGAQMRADVDPLNMTNFHTDRLFGLWVSPAFDNPHENAAYMLQGGLGMPDRDDYLKTDAKSKELQAAYRHHIAAVLRLANPHESATNSDAQAKRIYALEHAIAETHVSRTDSLEVLKADNPWPLAEFAKKAPGLDWPTYFSAAGLAHQKVIYAWQPKAVIGIAKLVGSEPLPLWKAYLRFHAIDRASPLLSKPFVDEHFAFYGTALTGATELRARWKRAVDATNAALGDAVGKLYVKRYFPPEAKAAAQAMVKNIVAAFGRRIDNLEWMTPATRAKAKAKLAALYIGIGYPEHWRDYSRLEVSKDDAYGNWRRSERFDYKTALEDLAKPVDRTEWRMEPQTVNALNVPLQNALNFPAAILAPPFFDAKTSPAQNYGGIGVVIGHEISHSFDDQGSQFGPYGKLANWWTKKDREHFKAAAEELIKQYDAYEPLPGMHVNGRLTLSENIADLAGLAASLEGYHASSMSGMKRPLVQGFTDDQRFFLSFAQIWRVKMRPAALRNQLLTNGHSPGRYRADTVRNIDAWYRAFGVTKGEKLYLPPAQRIQIW